MELFGGVWLWFDIGWYPLAFSYFFLTILWLTLIKCILFIVWYHFGNRFELIWDDLVIVWCFWYEKIWFEMVRSIWLGFYKRYARTKCLRLMWVYLIWFDVNWYVYDVSCFFVNKWYEIFFVFVMVWKKRDLCFRTEILVYFASINFVLIISFTRGKIWFYLYNFVLSHSEIVLFNFYVFNLIFF